MMEGGKKDWERGSEPRSAAARKRAPLMSGRPGVGRTDCLALAGVWHLLRFFLIRVVVGFHMWMLARETGGALGWKDDTLADWVTCWSCPALPCPAQAAQPGSQDQAPARVTKRGAQIGHGLPRSRLAEVRARRYSVHGTAVVPATASSMDLADGLEAALSGGTCNMECAREGRYLAPT